MAVTRQNLIDRLNAMRAATPANPIKKSDFAQFLEDWLNYMTNDGQYSAGVLEQWKTETLALQNAKLNADITLANNAAAQALASAAMASLVAQGQATARPFTRPSLSIDLANTRFLDPQIPFSRNSVGTYIDKFGVMRLAKVNQARFTHDPVTKECLGVMQEYRKTNLLTYSNDFSAYTKNNSNVITSAVKAPDLTVVQKLIVDSNNSPHNLNRGGIAVTQGLKYTGSIFAKAGEITQIAIQLNSSATYGGTNPNVMVDLLTGQILNSGNTLKPPKVENYGNGWWRIQVTQVASITATSGINISLVKNQSIAFLGDGVSGCYIFGAQFENSGRASSYMPTGATTFTRETDLIGLSGTSFSNLIPNFSEGSMFVSARKGYFDDNTYPSFITLAGPDTTNGPNAIRIVNVNDSDITSVIRNDGASFSQSFTVGEDNNFNCALVWKEGYAKAFCNGIAGNALAPTLPQNLNALNIEHVNGVIRQIVIWPRTITDAEALALTVENLAGKKPNQLPAVSDLASMAFLSPYAVLRTLGRQEFSVDCTGASITRNIRRPYAFTFEIIDSSGVTLTTQPSASCVENTDNSLVFTGPAGKTLTYAITPVFEY